ncbi:hypothetical protein ACFCX0_27700 [Streptomyces sp. NPDC056352]|uniref:hypothetical protein n=1 Tax=Streptomyces sp. NPDC056352 TaxID=3345791 RepID=UPI0035D56794
MFEIFLPESACRSRADGYRGPLPSPWPRTPIAPLRARIDKEIAGGPDDAQARLLFEYGPRFLRDAKEAALDSALTERQIAVCTAILVLAQPHGRFASQEPPCLHAAGFVAIEDSCRRDVLAGRRSHAQVTVALRAYARAITGRDLADSP